MKAINKETMVSLEKVANGWLLSQNVFTQWSFKFAYSWWSLCRSVLVRVHGKGFLSWFSALSLGFSHTRHTVFSCLGQSFGAYSTQVHFLHIWCLLLFHFHFHTGLDNGIGEVVFFWHNRKASANNWECGLAFLLSVSLSVSLSFSLSLWLSLWGTV